MPPKFFRKLLLGLVLLVVLFELICWIFIRFPVEPLRTLDLNNTIAGYKQKVRLFFGEDNVRYLDTTGEEKAAGAVRILCVGGWATMGLLQSAEDTWWGRLHVMLKQKGLKVETAARGYERVSLVEMAASTAAMAERLKPDIILLNAGYDDVIVHSAVYTYDKDKLSKMPVPPPPGAFKTFIFKVSQTARFKRFWNKDSEAKRMQNELGRKDVYAKYFESKRMAIHGDGGANRGLPGSEGILRIGGTNDPLPEYLDGLAAMRDIAAKHGAALILTGEACLHDSVTNHTAETSLLAYIALSEPEKDGNVRAARPDPTWVMHEMERFASSAETFAAEHKIPWLDLNGRISRNTDNFFSDVLLTDAGADIAAGLLLPVVEPVVRAK